MTSGRTPVRAVFVDFGGVMVRTADKGPRARVAGRLGMSDGDLEKIIFESDTARRASTGEISEEAHWQAVSEVLGVSRDEADAMTGEFFAGGQMNTALIDFLRGLRPGRRVGLISNAWKGLRPWITAQGYGDLFDEMIISAEVGLLKPDARIYRLALDRLGARPEESVFVDDVLANVEGARAVGMSALHFTQPEQSLQELRRLLAG